jgi:HK97 family phage major capsid protein
MKKKLKELLALRKAELAKVDGILTAAEASATKSETKEQTETRQACMVTIASLDAQIKIQEELIEARERSEELDKRHGGAETPAPRSGSGVADVRSGLSAQEHKDLQGYSFLRAFNAKLEGKDDLDGIEGEMHTEAVKEYRNAKIDRNGGNLLIPQLVLRSAGVMGSMERRDLTATGQTTVAGDQGGMTIQTNVGSLIDRLRKKLIMGQMGVTMLGGLQGNILFPKVVADDQAVERAENVASAESSATFSTISMSPRRLPVFAEISRQLLLQSSVDVEAWVRNDLAFQIAQVMDSRAINGSGTAQPFGILNAVGVGAVALGTNGALPTYDLSVDLETLVANLDADVGALGYITNTRVRGRMKKTLVAANTAGNMIWDKQNKATPLNEYPVGITNLVPNTLVKGASGAVCSAMAFGNFNDALMGQWGGLEFLVNPYSKDTEGLIRLNCWTFYDFIVRRAESFAVCKDILT